MIVKIKTYEKYLPIDTGDVVIVDKPGQHDLYPHSFIGTVLGVGRTIAIVKDQNNNEYYVGREKVIERVKKGGTNNG